MLPALRLDERLDGSRHHVLAVADDLGIGLGRRHGATGHTRVAMMQAALAVVGVNEAAGTGIHRGERLVIGSVRMPDGRYHAACIERRDVLERTILLSRKRALHDAAAGLLLPAIEDLDRGIDEELGVLRAHVRRGEERPLKEDASDVRAHVVLAASIVGLRDGGASAADVLDGLGKGRGQPRRRARLGERYTRIVDSGGIAIGGRVVMEAVDMRIDKAGAHDGAGIFDDLARRLLGRPTRELPILDGEVATLHGGARQYELGCRDGKRTQENSSQQQAHSTSETGSLVRSTCPKTLHLGHFEHVPK